MARSTSSTPGTTGMDLLNNILSSASGTVEVPVTELHAVGEKLDHAVLFLAEIIDEKMKEQGFDSLDDANEGSPELCNLLFLLGLIEDAGFVTEQNVMRTMVSDEKLQF